ncbi:hypothetical protein F2Q69_00017126 [Brassica cretica]|uniref:Uncharacterized protein n=1 Tax=Brassica cretica TaxID=69181 RepID=A0A8S9R7G4_BRACR|nr:hypothetical protein F2Q69_00017126 [Brassica cretica]
MGYNDGRHRLESPYVLRSDSDEVSVTGCVEGFRELALLGEGDRFGSGLVSLRHRWQSGASLPPSCLRLASCSFISVGLSHSLSRWLSVDVLFLVAACRFFGASGTGPVSDPSLRLLYSTFSRSSSLGMKLWVGVAASLTVEMHYLLRGSGRSREINLRLPPQEPLFFIDRGRLANTPPPVAVKVSPGLLRFHPYPRPVFSFAVYSE